MANNPLLEAQRQGIKAVNDLGVLFGRLGTSAHPNSQTLIAYRNARRALASVVKSGGSPTAAREITSQLRATARASIVPIFRDATSRGYENAVRQLELYKLVPPGKPDFTQDVLAAYNVIDTTLQKQEAALTAMLLSGTDENIILGDQSRAGVLRASEVVMAAAFWVANLWWGSFSDTAGQVAGGGFQKQAVAALDRRTTDCCLRVHGQIQPINTPFHLTGSPAYADYIDWPPFHSWCRTSGVLYKAEYDDGLTERMTESAQTVLEERANGIYKDRHPADAFI